MTIRESVFDVMRDGLWRTSDELQDVMLMRHGRRGSQSGVTAKLRDLRKAEHGGHTVESRKTTRPDAHPDVDLWEYRLIRAGAEGAGESTPLSARLQPDAPVRPACESDGQLWLMP